MKTDIRIDEAPFNSRKHVKMLHLYIEIRERITELTQKYLSDIDTEQERLNLMYSLADKGIREELLKLARHNFK